MYRLIYSIKYKFEFLINLYEYKNATQPLQKISNKFK